MRGQHKLWASGPPVVPPQWGVCLTGYALTSLGLRVSGGHQQQPGAGARVLKTGDPHELLPPSLHPRLSLLPRYPQYYQKDYILLPREWEPQKVTKNMNTRDSSRKHESASPNSRTALPKRFQCTNLNYKKA